LRFWFLGFAAISTVGTAVELAAERHWGTAVRLIPWYATAALTVGLVLLVAVPRSLVVRLVRVIAVAVAITGLIGIYEHVHENYIAGPLDYRYTEKWPTMSFTSRWWAALSKTVGPAPILAPGILIQAAAFLFLATHNHPALRASRPTDSPTSAPVDLTERATVSSSSGW
jgi:hypothetical protein